MPKVKIQTIVNYWLKNSDRKWDTALSLVKGRHYLDALFFCHLSLECTLKALYVVRKKQPAPFIHDLEALARHTEVPLNSRQKNELKEITKFNIGTRYPDERFTLYKRATNVFTKQLVEQADKYRVWFRKLTKEEKH